VEIGEGVVFIDKHAAHERLHFDELKSDGFDPMSQQLITPVVCRFGSEDAALLLENVNLTDKLGFSVESFGEDSIAARAIPSVIEIDDVETVLSDICSLLRFGASAESSLYDGIFRSLACKAAIKSGKSSDPAEHLTLVSEVMAGTITECPHGRPVAHTISKTALDRNFKRI
jgi:DNA mismatch repair protein MutL